MLENRIRRIMNSAAAIDKINNNDNKHRSYKVQVMISTIKSLIPSTENKGVIINYQRYIKEIELLKDYIDGSNKKIIDREKNDYWNNKSQVFSASLIPIVIANEDYEIARKEIIKTILYFTGDINTLLNGIVLGRLLKELINSNEINGENILSNLKDEIIKFSQKEFITDHENDYNRPLEEYKGNFLVDFEINRIEVINLLNKKEYDNNSLLSKSIRIILNKGEISISEVDDLFISAIVGIYLDDISKMEYTDRNFVTRISDYLIKLRKGRIDPENLKTAIITLPNIFNYKVGEVIKHPLLNKSQIIKKEQHNGSTLLEVMTKSGLYIFKK